MERKAWNKGKKLTEVHKKNLSNARKEFYKNNPHPRGMFGKTNKWGHHSEETKKLIGENARDRKYPNRKKPPVMHQQQKIKISDKLKGKNIGKNNGMWQGGLSFEPYDKTFNNKFKRVIRKRDNQICMLCGIHKEKLNRALDIHHIDYDKKLSIPQNCISLCNSCHAKTNFNRKHWIKFFQSLLLEKYGYNYSENQEIIMEVKHGGL